MENLLREIRGCTICKAHLSHGPRPIVNAHLDSKIAIIGQAPGMKVHQSGIPWDDKSGDNLRSWLGVSAEKFYDIVNFAIIPMGFCFPGKSDNGDLPPRPECAPQWHHPLIDKMNKVRLTLLIGKYAQAYYLGRERKKNLTETVRNFSDYLPLFFVLPHPSPRNFIWKARNPWFEENVLPRLKDEVSHILID